ncbi:MAG: aldo/keto reductase, partial [Acidobacteria bacterium]|nr:aldo/keto reductase [Acidobacteriota bacterium]
WDLADHYGPAENFIGEFSRRLAESQGQEALQGMQAFTKWVPRAGPMTLPIVRENVDLSLRRMGVEAIDLLQFHWWDYQDSAYLDALVHLSQLRDEGLIKHVALTNFDTERLERISAHGVRVVSNQVQYSLIDRRPEIQMVPFCLDHHVQLLAYGTLCGGLLSETYLGQPEPARPAASFHTTTFMSVKPRAGVRRPVGMGPAPSMDRLRKPFKPLTINRPKGPSG